MKEIKKYIQDNIGNTFIITTDADKKRCESVRCVIKEVYHSLFIVEVIDKHIYEKVRSYSYSDIYSKQIEMEKIS